MKWTTIALAVLAASANATNIRSATGASEHYTPYEPDLSAHEIATVPEANAFYAKLQGKCAKLKNDVKTARTTSEATCSEEITKTKQYIDSGSKESTEDNEAREKSSRALYDAVHKRAHSHVIAADRLLKHQAKLTPTIQRVNKIFKAKYDENTLYAHAVTGKSGILAKLAVIVTAHQSPRMKPIKNFAQWAEHLKNLNAPAPEPQKKSATALVEMAAGSHSSAKIARAMVEQFQQLKAAMAKVNPCESKHYETCKRARKEAFELWAKALQLSTAMFHNFELDRGVLKAVRQGIEGESKNVNECMAHPCRPHCSSATTGAYFIRRCKHKKLYLQLNRIKAAQGRDEDFNGKRLKEHLQILERVCPKHKKNSELEEQKISELCKIIDANHAAPIKASTGATGGN